MENDIWSKSNVFSMLYFHENWIMLVIHDQFYLIKKNKKQAKTL